MIYPDGTRHHSIQYHRCQYVIEQNPGVRTLSFDSSFGFGSSSYNLSLPYTIFIFTFDFELKLMKLHMGFSTESLKSIDQLLFLCCLPNVDDYEVCIRDKICRDINIKKHIENIINEFWNSDFNADFCFNFNSLLPVSIKDWHEGTKINKFYGLQIPWNKTNGRRLSSFLLQG